MYSQGQPVPAAGYYSGAPPQGGYPQNTQNTGYPPQGYPPQGYPPQGYPPQGYPPQGYPPQSYPQQGYPPQVYAAPVGAQPGYPPAVYAAPMGVPPPGAPAYVVPPAACIITPQDPWSALANVNMFFVEQKADLMEALTQGIYDAPNKYKIYTNEGYYILNAKEESQCFNRCCCHPDHELTLHISVPTYTPPYMMASMVPPNPDIFTVYKPFKCCCCAWGPCCQKEVTVRAGSEVSWRYPIPLLLLMIMPFLTCLAVDDQEIGYVQQPLCAGGFTPVLDIYDKQGGNQVGQVVGPCCCIGGICCDANFSLQDPKGQPLGKITKMAAKDMTDFAVKMFTDADKFTISFPPYIDARTKATMFGTLLFLDYLFFEDEGACRVNPDGSCTVKFCDVYCCGSTTPCACTCGGNSGGGGGGDGGGDGGGGGGDGGGG